MKFRNNLQRLCIVLCCTIVLAACKKSDINTAQQNLYGNSISSSNYVANPQFADWNTGTSLPKNWQVSLANNDLSTLSNAKPGIALHINAEGSNYIYQPVKLETNQFYKATLSWQYDIKDYSKGGLYIMDASMQTVLGKAEKAYKTGQDTVQIIFNSKQYTTINFVAGFLEGMNASVTLKQATITPYTFVPKIESSAFSKYLTERMDLSFDRLNFDSSIAKVSDYVNEVLLCHYYGNDNCSQQNNWLIGMLDKQKDYTYFIKNLHEQADIINSYCQRSSLTLDEILSNEFHIPTRQIHMVVDGTGKHQFLQYWNPYLEKWIVIDPCFSCRYIENGIPKSIDEIKINNIPANMKTFGSHFYYTALDELVWLWQNLQRLETDTEYSITYPFDK